MNPFTLWVVQRISILCSMYSNPKRTQLHKSILSANAPERSLTACLSFEISDQLSTIQLTPAGRFRAVDGRPFEVELGWLIDDAHANALIEKLKQRKNKVVVDYEHATQKAKVTGQPNPAAGWIDPNDFYWESGKGLFAKVQWTETAKSHIKAKEYLYISPVFEYDPSTGEVLELFTVAITNDPGLDGMMETQALTTARMQEVTPAPPCAREPSASMHVVEQRMEQLSSKIPNQPQTPTEDIVDREKLIKLLGLSDDATEADINNAIEALKHDKEHMTELCNALGVADGEDPKAKVASLTTLADPAQNVPLTVVEDLKSQIAELQRGASEDKKQALLDKGVAEGKLLPVQLDWAKGLSVASLSAYLDKTPAIVALSGQHQSGGGKAVEVKPVELSAEDKTAASALGLTHQEYIKGGE